MRDILAVCCTFFYNFLDTVLQQAFKQMKMDHKNDYKCPMAFIDAKLQKSSPEQPPTSPLDIGILLSKILLR